MIKSLHLENFQSHKDSLLEFVPGMNVIIGSSDSGKTAIIRAFNWVKNNRPSGDSFRNNKGGDTISTITTIEGDIISREKTNKVNAYKLSSIKEPFLAFSQDGPEEIQYALNMDNINIQQQLDSPFLLSETSGYISAHFNKIAKLEKIDKSRNNIQSEITSLTASLKSDKKIIDEKSELLESFIDVDSLEKELEKIEAMELKQDTLYKSIEKVRLINRAYETLLFDISEKEKVVDAETDLNKILALYVKRNEAAADCTKLTTLEMKIYKAQQRIEEADRIVLAEIDINKIINLYITLQQTREKATNIQKVITRLEQKEINRGKLLKQLIEIEKEFHESFPEICPLCNTPLKKK